MLMPFERLMEYAAGLGKDDARLPLGTLAARVEEAPERLADAIAAVRVMRGERTYIGPADIRAASDPVVRQVLLEDRGGVASGAVTSFFAVPGSPSD